MRVSVFRGDFVINGHRDGEIRVKIHADFFRDREQYYPPGSSCLDELAEQCLADSGGKTR